MEFYEVRAGDMFTLLLTHFHFDGICLWNEPFVSTGKPICSREVGKIFDEDEFLILEKWEKFGQCMVKVLVCGKSSCGWMMFSQTHFIKQNNDKRKLY